MAPAQWRRKQEEKRGRVRVVEAAHDYDDIRKVADDKDG